MGLLSKMTGGPDRKLLETGLLGRGIITGVRPTGTTLDVGNGLAQRLCVFTAEVLLTVMPHGGAPYQVQVGNPTPSAALPFLFPGSRVPVKIGTIPNAVVIDWEAAAAEDPR